jgi:hypothetical protein
MMDDVDGFAVARVKRYVEVWTAVWYIHRATLNVLLYVR